MQSILEGIITFVAGVFSNDWDKAWQGIKEIFRGIVNGIITIFESMLNFVINGINNIIAAANSLADKVPGLGSFVNIPSIPEVSFPRLATGAVIPPNREFLAVLGDQKQGTNIEAPLETIVQAVMLALAKSGYSGGDGQIIENVLELDGEVIYRNQKKVSRRHGVSLVGGRG